MKIKVRSNAKINIGLNIEGVLENGYHSLDMTMIPIDLCDEMEIDFKGKNGTLKIFSEDKNIPLDEKNIIYKVYNHFYELTNFKFQEIEVVLKKNIPMEAGLGGGSSNGAFFLKELNKYHNNFYSDEELIKKFKFIGADIPFFILNKSCRAKGIGEELELFPNNLKNKILLIKPNFGVSTVIAFKNFDNCLNKEYFKKADILKIIEGVKKNSLYKIIENMENQLEQGLLIGDNNIIEFRNILKKITEKKFFMSGSGSCYYTFLEPDEEENLSNQLKQQIKNCKIYICNFLEC
ncbi:MAG: 4-(cytidine 5'-diphospho)-2-C-methyl-D-erythritol kinase [Fusobacteriaceae bacterium]